MMNKKRLITTSVISIFLVAVLLIGSTYSIFFSHQIDPNSNVYTTGNLDIIYTLDEDNIIFSNIIPMSENEAEDIVPYRITVTNKGTVPYKFNIILNSTTANTENEIDEQYIMTKVGNLESKSLAECPDNIIKENIILNANESVEIDIRIWISELVKNSEIGKSFYGKIVIDGLAIYDEKKDIDNSNLSLNYIKTLYNNPDDTAYYKNLDYRDKIISASFVDYIDTSNSILDKNNNIVSWDLSLAQNNSVIAWLEESDMPDEYKLYIGSKEKIYAKDLSNLFSNMKSLRDVEFTNISSITTEKMHNMFYNCNNLGNIDLSPLDTQNVLDISNMFFGCNNIITSIVISNEKTSNYDNIFTGAAIADGASITLKHTDKTKELVEQIASTSIDNPNIKIAD